MSFRRSRRESTTKIRGTNTLASTKPAQVGVRICATRRSSGATEVVQNGPGVVTIGPVASVALERIELLELLGMTLAHLNDAESRAEVSPRVPLLMAIRDKLALALREEL